MNIWKWVLLAVLLLTQGTILFIDARKRGAHAWLWGIAGLIQFPGPTIAYLICLLWRRKFRRNR